MNKEELIEKLKCPICIDLLTEPISYKCGHNMCLCCHKKLLDDGRTPKCPQCRSEISRYDSYNKNIILSDMIRSVFPDEYNQLVISKKLEYDRGILIKWYDNSEQYKTITHKINMYFITNNYVDYNSLTNVLIDVSDFEVKYVICDMLNENKLAMCKEFLMKDNNIIDFIKEKGITLTKEEFVNIITKSTALEEVADSVTHLQSNPDTLHINLKSFKQKLYTSTDENKKIFHKLKKMKEGGTTTIIAQPIMTRPPTYISPSSTAVTSTAVTSTAITSTAITNTIVPTPSYRYTPAPPTTPSTRNPRSARTRSARTHSARTHSTRTGDPPGIRYFSETAYPLTTAELNFRNNIANGAFDDSE
jgi:hypothetical protein